MISRNKISLVLFLGAIIFSGGAFLYAAAPSGGYGPGDTLDPDCAPNDVDCLVAIPTGGSYNGTAGRFVVTDGAGNLTDSADALFESGNVYVRTDTAALNGETALQMGSVAVPGFGAFDGLGLSSSFEASSGDTYTSSMFMGSATPFGGIPIAQLYMENSTTGESVFNRLVDGGGMSVQVGYGNSSSETSMSIIDGAIGFKVDDVSTFSIPTSAGTSGYVLQTDGSGTTSWVDASSGAAGNDTEIQFNKLGELEAVSSIRFDPASGGLILGESSVAQGELIFENAGGGSGQLRVSSTDASTLVLSSGVGTGLVLQTKSENLALKAGGSGASGYGVSLQAGDAQTGGGQAGSINLRAGNSGGSYAGNVTIQAGDSTGDYTFGSNIFLKAAGLDALRIQGNGNISFNTPTSITFNINSTPTFSIPTSAGISGAVLTTDGAGLTNWSSIPESPIATVNGNNLFSNAPSFDAGTNVTTSSYSIFLGENAGDNATSASRSNFFGQDAGSGATSAENSNFLGYGAGQSASAAANSNFLGLSAGYGATGASYSNFLGYWSGLGSNSASNSNFFGAQAGQSAESANNSNFFGAQTGVNADSAAHSNFFGSAAGISATNASNSNFFGQNAGHTATNATRANFIGYSSGFEASDAAYSSFLGQTSGYQATNAAYSTFIGSGAGYQAANARNSIFIGTDVGYMDSVDNGTDPDDYSILIGNDASTGGFENSIAIGKEAMNTASNQFMIGSAARPIDELRIVSTGGTSCAIVAAGISCSSDETLKKDIADIGNGLDIINQLQGVTYHWLKDDNAAVKTPGFIAQDVKDILPEAVTYDASTGKYAMNYTQIIPYLVEAVKTLNAAVNSGTVAGANVGELVVNRLRAHEICLDDLCIDRDDLQNILNQTNTQVSNPDPIDLDPEVDEPIIPETPVDETPTAEDPAPQGQSVAEAGETAGISDDSEGQIEPEEEIVPDEPVTESAPETESVPVEQTL